MQTKHKCIECGKVYIPNNKLSTYCPKCIKKLNNKADKERAKTLYDYNYHTTGKFGYNYKGDMI